ncbi:MAG: fructose-bisphosphatase class II family protein [Chloroflexi bacterium]|nr:fructose-bisphosphatase class II family protein [Chloroflexota bacterium]
MMNNSISPNLGLDLVRVTEAAAFAAGRWMGRGDEKMANRDAISAMAKAFEILPINGRIVIGEERRQGIPTRLDSGQQVGSGYGPAMDVVVDAIDGTALLIRGLPGALSVAGIAPRDSMWAPHPATHMEKIIVGPSAAHALVPECMDAPAAWTLALVARAKKKAVRDLVVFVLSRPRHQDLIEEIQATGARVMALSQGDIAGALMVANHDVNVDILMGTGGISEGIVAACAVKSLRGAMLGRVMPIDDEEEKTLKEAGTDCTKILTQNEIIVGCDIYFAATGITEGVLLSGVHYAGDKVEAESMVIRCQTGTRRNIFVEHTMNSLKEE